MNNVEDIKYGNKDGTETDKIPVQSLLKIKVMTFDKGLNLFKESVCGLKILSKLFLKIWVFTQHRRSKHKNITLHEKCCRRMCSNG